MGRAAEGKLRRLLEGELKRYGFCALRRHLEVRIYQVDRRDIPSSFSKKKPSPVSEARLNQILDFRCIRFARYKFGILD